MVKEPLLIRYLLTHPEDISIRQLAQGLKMDYKNVHTLVQRLKKTDLVKTENFGQACKIKLNLIPHPLVYQAEYQRREEILKNKNISTVLEYYRRNLKSRFYILLLFGSYAKNTSTKQSDIDLMFILPDKAEEKEFEQVTSMIPLNIHLSIFTEKEFLAMKNSKEITVGSEAIKNNLLLHGIELYYEMIA